MSRGPLLIADDFGLGAGHNQVILALLENRRIGATSVMIDGHLDPQSIERLRRCREDGAQLGLHLNLTHAFADKNTSYPLKTLMRDSLTGHLPAGASADLARQASAFETMFGFLPDYYDGHQHCHCLPGLAQATARLPRHKQTWIRIPLPASFAGLHRNIRAGGIKTGVIATLAWNARRIFKEAGWPVNDDFSGFLRLDNPAQTARWLPRLLQSAGENCVVMVHPGSATDPVQCDGHAPQSRSVEADILNAGTPVTAKKNA